MATFGGFQVGPFQPLPAYQQVRVDIVQIDSDWAPYIDRDWRKQKKKERARRKKIAELFAELTGEMRVPKVAEVAEIKARIAEPVPRTPPEEIERQIELIQTLEKLLNELIRIELALREDEDVTLLLLM